MISAFLATIAGAMTLDKVNNRIIPTNPVNPSIANAIFLTKITLLASSNAI